MSTITITAFELADTDVIVMDDVLFRVSAIRISEPGGVFGSALVAVAGRYFNEGEDFHSGLDTMMFSTDDELDVLHPAV